MISKTVAFESPNTNSFTIKFPRKNCRSNPTNIKEIFMEFFIFKSQQVLSRESAIAMVTKILFLRGGEAAAQKKIVVDVATRVAALALERVLPH